MSLRIRKSLLFERRNGWGPGPGSDRPTAGADAGKKDDDVIDAEYEVKKD